MSNTQEPVNQIDGLETLPRIKFLVELSKQTTFGQMKLELLFKKVEKRFKITRYAQECFKVIVEQAMIQEIKIEDEIIKYFIENNPDEIRRKPLRIKGKCTHQDENGHWQVEIYLNFSDWENPGIVTTDTLDMNTKKEIKKDAIAVMTEMAKKVSEDALAKFGQGGHTINMKTGKAL